MRVWGATAVTYPTQRPAPRQDEWHPTYVYIPYDVANIALILLVIGVVAWAWWTMHLCQIIRRYEGS